MKNRSILARLGAKVKPVKKVKAESNKILKSDPETGQVVETFDSLDAALASGLHRPNLVGAINKGSKYKGHLWAEE
jgi:hypothetical protein